MFRNRVGLVVFLVAVALASLLLVAAAPAPSSAFSGAPGLAPLGGIASSAVFTTSDVTGGLTDVMGNTTVDTYILIGVVLLLVFGVIGLFLPARRRG